MKHTIVISQEELEEIILEDLLRQGIKVEPTKGWLTWRSNGDHAGVVTVDLEVEVARLKVPDQVFHPQIELPVSEPKPVAPKTDALEEAAVIPLDTSMFPDTAAAALLNEQIARMTKNENADGTLYPGETPHRTQEAHSMEELLKGWGPRRGSGR